MGVEKFVPWGSASPSAIPQQMAARIADQIATGRAVHVVACVIELNERGNYVYTVTSSEMKAEVALMAVHQIKQNTLRLMEHE